MHYYKETIDELEPGISDKTLVCILAGGKGTRMQRWDLNNNKSNPIPKPLINIGYKHLIMHIMDHYFCFGLHKFNLLLGYQAPLFETKLEFHRRHRPEYYHITYSDTGPETGTGGRILAVKDIIKDYKYLMLTYGDGISNINIKNLLHHHISLNRIATITAVKRPENFGILRIENNIVKAFNEKPKSKTLINGGFMVFTVKRFLDILEAMRKLNYYSHYSSTDFSLEHDILPYLSQKEELTAFVHDGYWHCMDTYKDYLELCEHYNLGIFV